MINKSFVIMKIVFIFYQKFSIEVRKSFEECKRNRSDQFLFSIIEMIEITKMIKIIKTIEMSELREIMMRIKEYKNKSIENKLIIK